MSIQKKYENFKSSNKSIANFSIITDTGIELFNGESINNQNVTVLVAAIASATNSLQENLGHQQVNRFSICNSSQGYLIEYLKINNLKCLAFLAYHDERNPGKLSWDFRRFVESINGSEVAFKEKRTIRDNYLFDHISDDEIDRLFFGAEV
jgi:hypothetical protein